MKGSSSRRYLVYGLVVESSAELTSIVETTDRQADPLIRLSFAEPHSLRSIAVGLPAEPDDWIQYNVLEDGGIYIKVRAVFEAVVSHDGRTASCARLGDIDARSFEANLLNFVLAASFVLQGEEPLHATVVDVDGRAIGFLGPSGAGKSTLAARLIGQGAELITDDMLRLVFEEGRALAHLGPDRLKLYDDSARYYLPAAAQRGHFNSLNEKVMLQPRLSADARRVPRPLSALFCLGHREPQANVEDVVVKRLEGIELAKTIIASTMNRRYQRSQRVARQFQFAERLARTVPVYALGYPRRFEVMDRVVEQILRRTGV